MQIQNVKVANIKPYAKNPRKNDGAVDAVAESIRQCGYCAPILVDENMLVLAGHTRLKAIKKLGWTDIEVCIKTGLTEEQKRKYRLLDNKTGELAGWDFGLLEAELADMDLGELNVDWNLPDAEAICLDDAEGNGSQVAKLAHCPKCGFTFEV